MPYVKMPKDLSRVKTKMAFNLTKRQLISFGLAALFGAGTFFLTRKSLGTDGAAVALFIAAMPFFLAGMYEKNGQPFEKVLKQMINTMFIRPKKRPYKMKNYYEYLERQYDLNEEIRKIVKEDGKKSKRKGV